MKLIRKTIGKRIFSMLMVCAMVLCGVFSVSAADQQQTVELVLGANATEFTFKQGSPEIRFSNVIPGDKATQKTIITNNRTQSIDLYMKTNQARSVSSELLNLLKLRIENENGGVLYEKTLAAHQASGDTKIATVPAGQTYTMNVIIIVPVEVNNNHLTTTSLSILWELLAEFDGTSRSSTSRTGNSRDTDTVQDDEDSDDYYIPEPSTPTTQTPTPELPKTGKN